MRRTLWYNLVLTTAEIEQDQAFSSLEQMLCAKNPNQGRAFLKRVSNQKYVLVLKRKLGCSLTKASSRSHWEFQITVNYCNTTSRPEDTLQLRSKYIHIHEIQAKSVEDNSKRIHREPEDPVRQTVRSDEILDKCYKSELLQLLCYFDCKTFSFSRRTE